MNTKGIYAGSFDPLTNGHLDIIRRASRLFNSLIVAVGINPSKKYSFSAKERMLAIKNACADLPTVEVDTMGNDLLVHYAKGVGATHVVRGIRSHKDFDDESMIQRVNKDIDPSMEPVFFIPNKEFIDVSSSLVKALVGPKYWHYVVKKYVPENVFDSLVKKELLSQAEYFKPFLVPDADLIYKHYGTKERRYHNVEHLLDMFNEFKRVEPLCNNRRSMVDAIYFHDILDTEKESADMFYGFNSREVKKLIMATDHSREDVGDFTNDEKLIHDIDLSILASDPAIYRQYCENVFLEYEVKLNIDVHAFNKGRKEFLVKMLDKKRIFLHGAFDEYEKKARYNIGTEYHRI